MLSHTHLGVTDFPRAFAFYSILMEELGCVLKFTEPEKAWAGWMQPSVERPLFLIGHPVDGNPAQPGNGQMLALLARDRRTVDRCHAKALTFGCVDEGSPGLRPLYHPDFYGAYFRDLDGNKLCICCHGVADGSAL
jgi:catechol 2,3-dioxygenase-like lactoylglutathione lyase family enzyme